MERRRDVRTEAFMIKRESGGFIPVFMFSRHSDGTIPVLILDISLGGCGILISKNQSIDFSLLRLKLVGTDQVVGGVAEVKTRQCWVDPHYSIDHMAVGLQFVDPQSQAASISELIRVFKQLQATDTFIRCELTPITGKDPS
jgi:hypothetical protein